MTYAEWQARQIVDEWIAIKVSMGLPVQRERYEEFVRAILTEGDNDEL